MDWLADLEVNRFLWDRACTVEQARRIAEAVVDLHQCRFGHWAIQDKDSGVVHPWTELRKLRPWSGPSDQIALSYVLPRP